ncbi:GDYXXLXY domain-containing protein [Sphingobacteriaceae bacterium WQ 2009]|uniref:GDYXXLXY domain-containing protein n=1 Tax=Rhinopithecimicrobium faecis TaxID=2820698 RepID=A0A8T4HB90_9SPHI|nr:GDYXXLXY domain-containing protein [Sphingobacteriaceae bacterium WQ 2009]
MKKYKWAIVLINLILFLAYCNYSIAKKEVLIKEGTLVLLRLAPVDPRSLMQGDYMALNYEIATNHEVDSIPKNGYCVVKLDANQVAHLVRFQAHKQPLAAKEHLIKYAHSNPWSLNIGAESYFFQEGEAEKYELAEFGALRIDKEGNSVLVGLYNTQLQQLK